MKTSLKAQVNVRMLTLDNSVQRGDVTDRIAQASRPFVMVYFAILERKHPY